MENAERLGSAQTESVVCPRCYNVFRKRFASLCRRDNETNICPDCGTAEALEDFMQIGWQGHKYWKE